MADPENATPNQLIKIRTQGLKSRNSNHTSGAFSLTENGKDGGNFSHGISNAGGPFIQGIEDNQRKSFQGGPPLLRNYDSETSIFADMRGGNNLNENSFNEQILDRNKLIYQQHNVSTHGGAPGERENKRTNSSEKLHHRPRSSKGNRSLVSAGNAGLFVSGVVNAPQQTVPKFVTNKSEERANKSQQQQRSLTGK